MAQPNVMFEKRANQKRIEQDEKELEELLKASSPQEEEETQEETEEVLEKEEEGETQANLSPEEKSFKKRYGDLRRHMAEKEKEWKERLEAMEKRLDNETVTPPKSDEDIEAWAKKYPDVAGIVETIAQKKAQELFAKAEDRLKEYDSVRYEATKTKAENEIRKVHPDFDDLRDSDSFHDWAEEQPKWVQDALYENMDDARSVIRVLDLYKVDKGLTSKDNKAKAKEAAKAVSTNSRVSLDTDESSKKFRESEVAKMSDKEYEKNEEKILEAMRTGNFIYDISGGAR